MPGLASMVLTSCALTPYTAGAQHEGTAKEVIEAREVKTLVIAHKDRLVRFGFGWFQLSCTAHGCELLVLNQETLSPEQEMAQNLMTIVHCFSLRLYGLRNYRKALTEALKEPLS